MPTPANSLNITQQGTVYFNGIAQFSGIDGGASGNILTSNGTGVAPSFQAAPAGGVTTINGDTGSITGTTVTIFSNNATLNAGSSVKFVNSGTISTLNLTDALNNTMIGKSSGNAALASQFNCGLGVSSLSSLVTGSSNVGIGYSSLTTLNGGQSNTAIGTGVFLALANGNFNIGIGRSTGSGYNGSETQNILINNSGVAGESGVIRIGTVNQQTTNFQQGIYQVVVPSSEIVTIDTNGQLGSVPGPAIQFFTFVTAPIDLKVVAVTTLLSSVSSFAVTNIIIKATSITGVFAGATMSIGTNSATWDNYLTGGSVTQPQNTGQITYNVLGPTITQVPPVDFSHTLKLNVTVADTATTDTVVFYIQGFYL